MNEKVSKRSPKFIPLIHGQVKIIPMILPLYVGYLDCGCKVQVKGYMYSNKESNPNLLMLTSFNFAYKIKFGWRLVLCELWVCFSLVK